MKNNKNIPLSTKVYFKLRSLIVPFEIIEKYVPKEGIVVDLGCGFGSFTNFLAIQSTNRKVIGIDLNEKRILLANKIFGHLSNLNFICSNITDTKIPKVRLPRRRRRALCLAPVHRFRRSRPSVRFRRACQPDNHIR